MDGIINRRIELANKPNEKIERNPRFIDKIINEIISDKPDLGLGNELQQILLKIWSKFDGSPKTAKKTALLLDGKEKQVAIEYLTYLNDASEKMTDSFLSEYLIKRRILPIKALKAN
ncbi:MAG: hypothetical protein WCQ49_02025 [Candidatus Saccharibacteria bacterium]